MSLAKGYGVKSVRENEQKNSFDTKALQEALHHLNPQDRNPGDPKPSEAYIAHVRAVLDKKPEEITFNEIVYAANTWGEVELGILVKKVLELKERYSKQDWDNLINRPIKIKDGQCKFTTILGIIHSRYEALIEENLGPSDNLLIERMKCIMNQIIHAGGLVVHAMFRPGDYNTKETEGYSRAGYDDAWVAEYKRNIGEKTIKVALDSIGTFRITSGLERDMAVCLPHFEGFEFCPDPSVNPDMQPHKAYKHIAAATQLTQHLGHIVAGYYLEDKPVTEDKPKGADTAAAPAPTTQPTDTKWRDEVGRGNAAAAAVAKRDSSPKADGDRARG